MQKILSNIGCVKPLQIAVIVGILYLFNSESLFDIIRICFYGNTKENLLNVKSEIIAVAIENFQNTHYLECITRLKLFYSSRTIKWLSAGARLIYVKPYE